MRGWSIRIRLKYRNDKNRDTSRNETILGDSRPSPNTCRERLLSSMRSPIRLSTAFSAARATCADERRRVYESERSR